MKFIPPSFPNLKEEKSLPLGFPQEKFTRTGTLGFQGRNHFQMQME